jgi:hypothetical protein
MAVVKGHSNAKIKIENFEGGQSNEDRNAGWRYFLEKTNLKPGMDPEKATKLRQARFDVRESSPRPSISDRFKVNGDWF